MKISTSILNSNNRIESIVKLNNTNTSYIHLDIMDGKFVANKELDKINEIKSFDLISEHPLDIHLMVENPIYYIEKLENMNIEYISFHIEVEKDIEKIINKIKKLGYKVGLAIKPNTNINKLKPYLDAIDLILIMSVEPGKGGQPFISTTPNRIKKIKELVKNRNILIEVDGGINDETINKIKDVDISVVGTYIINSDNYYKQIEKLLNNKKITRLIITIATFILIIILILLYNKFKK